MINKQKHVRKYSGALKVFIAKSEHEKRNFLQFPTVSVSDDFCEYIVGCDDYLNIFAP